MMMITCHNIPEARKWLKLNGYKRTSHVCGGTWVYAQTGNTEGIFMRLIGLSTSTLDGMT